MNQIEAQQSGFDLERRRPGAKAGEKANAAAIAFSSPCGGLSDEPPPCSSPAAKYGYQKTGSPQGAACFLVPLAGIEPARLKGRRILSPLRLPVPPQRQIHEYFSILFSERQAWGRIFELPRNFIGKYRIFCRKFASGLAFWKQSCYDIVTYL